MGIVYITSFFSRYFSRPVLGKAPFVKPNLLFAFLSMACLIIISGLRDDIGDTFFYMHSYKLMSGNLSHVKFDGSYLFNLYQALLHQFSSDPQLLIFVTALITNALIVFTLVKYSRMIELSLFIYIAAGMFMVSMNGIRQFMAAAIIFAATKYILNGKFIKFLIVVILASFIHSTSLIFIPTYFIVRREAWTKMTLVLLVIGIVGASAFNQFSNVLFTALSSTKYDQYSNVAAHGASIIRPIIAAVPIIIAYLGRDKLRALWPKSDYIVNLALLDVVFEILATKNWLFNRLDIYFGLYQLILISWIVQLFVKKQQKFVYLLMLGCYVFFFYYEEVVKQGIIYTSKFIK